jgi:SecD/SecF fusion protein
MFSQFSLLAQVDSTPIKVLYFIGFVLIALVLPFVIGRFAARSLRMENYGWKIGLILASVVFSLIVVGRTWTPVEGGGGKFDIKLGVDLKGGVILIYEVDENAPQSEGGAVGDGPFSMSALVTALTKRINPSGTKEIVIRPVGDRQVEIIVPEVDQNEVERIKREITTAGKLQFRIVANSIDHKDIIELAESAATALDPLAKRRQVVRDGRSDPVGLWARVAREQGEGEGRPFKLAVASATLREASTGDLLVVPQERSGDDPEAFARYIASLGIKEIDILMATNDGYDVTGANLGRVAMGNDEVLRPCILFNLQGEGIDRFAGLTREYSPQNNFARRLGILLDNELLSAPNIQEMIQGRGQITGRFTEEEVSFLVNILRAGSLPVVLNKNPISENLIDPLLGDATIRQGKFAIVVSISLVLVFILAYYRFSGAVACAALVANLLFIFALMISIRAALTLPGLAGLVLTVGMSVDANVLIFERIREELTRGSALRMAIRNGFARATTTIVDANVTTLITAVVLYAIGTDQIRGFSVTLIFGILMSMFTAIFCSRVIFDIAERSRSIKKLNMTQILGTTHIDFIGKRTIAAFVSTILICVGIVGIVARGADIFDIDFRGGTSVHMMFAAPVETDVVRGKLQQEFDGEGVRFTVTALKSIGGATLNNTFKVDSALAEVSELQDAIRRVFADQEPKLATYSLEYGELRTAVTISEPIGEQDEAMAAPTEGGESAEGSSSDGEAPGESEPAEPTTETASETSGDVEVQETDGEESPAPGDDDQSGLPMFDGGMLVAFADELPDMLAQATTTEEATVDGEEPIAEATSDEEFVELAGVEMSSRVEVDLTFGHAINAETLRDEIVAASAEAGATLADSDFVLDHPGWDGESSNAYKTWTLRIPATEAQTSQLLQQLEDKFASTPVWPSSNKIGGQVAGQMQRKAIAALLTSLLGIVIYIWIRFQRVIFGLAAVVALIHDVLVTLGAIAVSAWLAGALGFLLIEEFKISLPIVAALLTIMGYSLNDTIVVFDRIREVRGKSPDLTADMINTSINQTLSRTLLTSLTTLIVVAILYGFGGQGIHGFAFSLVVGVIAGTYSSIFVASPALLWMTGAKQTPRRKSAAA